MVRLFGKQTNKACQGSTFESQGSLTVLLVVGFAGFAASICASLSSLFYHHHFFRPPILTFGLYLALPSSESIWLLTACISGLPSPIQSLILAHSMGFRRACCFAVLLSACFLTPPSPRSQTDTLRFWLCLCAVWSCLLDHLPIKLSFV